MLPGTWRRADPSRHHFVGFPDDPHPGIILEQHLRIGNEPPRIETVKDAIFVPATLDSPNDWKTGGIMTADGALIPLVRERWSDKEDILGLLEPVEADPRMVVADEALYLGWIFDSFGHLLLETLARIWALREVSPQTPVIAHYFAGRTPPEHAFRMLELFGLSRDRLILPDHPVRVRTFLLPEPMVLGQTFVHERAGDAFREVAGRLGGSGPLREQPVYLSRRLVSAPQRENIGEAMLEEVLRDNGFLVVYPELLPLEEQIRLAASHRTLVTTTGSASQVFLFARPEAQVHLFCYTNLLEHHVTTAEIAQTATWYLNHLRGVRHPVSALAFDVKAATEHLHAAGLLPRGVGGTSLPEHLEHSPEFEEAWLFGLFFRDWPGLTDDDHAAAAAAVQRLRPTAWPVFAARAALPPDRVTDEEADAALRRFAEAIAGERDHLRLWRHRAIVRHYVAHAANRCSEETRRLALAAADRYLPPV